MLKAFEALFKMALLIKDKWYYENCSPSFIANNFNQIKLKGNKNDGNSVVETGELWGTVYTAMERKSAY
jgi:hypothetical protein